MTGHEKRTAALQKATSVDVARRAGVSQATVSRVFNAGAVVSEATRAKVMAAARQLGYVPNAIARSLITQQTNIVGLLMAHISSPFQPYIQEAFIQQLQERGRQVLVFSAGPDQEVDDLLPLVLQYRVAGLICTSIPLSSSVVAACRRHGIPVVLFNRYVPGQPVSAVCCDNVEGGRLVANLFLDAGHQQIACISGDPNSSTSRDRTKGFTDRLRERGTVSLAHEQGPYTYEAGYEAARRLLARSQRPDAVFCVSDVLALGAIDASRACGLRVPEDISVVGFDDIPMASWRSYALTTIREPVAAMVDTTIAMLLERLAAPETEAAIRLFPGTLVARQSARLASNAPRGDADARSPT